MINPQNLIPCYLKSIQWLVALFVLIHFSWMDLYAGISLTTERNKPGSTGWTQDSIRIKRIYNTVKVEVPPVIDGHLSDSCWQKGEWQSNYTQFTPVYNGKSALKTAIKILYNDKSVFVGIRAWDDMEKISRKLSHRDIFAGDIVGVHFDSYYDHRTAFEFDMTAAGQKVDVLVTNDGWDVNWNAVWYGKVAYEDSSWTAEFEIPLSQLRYGTAPDQIWGLNSWRLIERKAEENHWNLVANDGTGLVYTFGELHGLKNLKKVKRIELAPYLSGKITTDKKQSGNPFAKGLSLAGQAGLDAKIGITNNFTLDATINPDFGQVEADPSVMNLSAFETYFEEKRPFFLEGKNIFDYTFDKDYLFYTRRIGHAPSFFPAYDTIRIPENTTIGGAFKLSGKNAHGLSLGIIESVAMNETAEIHNNNQDFTRQVEPLTNYFIGRFQKDYNQGNTILGGIITHTHRVIRHDYLNFLSRDALTYGLDFTKYWKDRKYILELKTVGSSIQGDKTSIQRLQTASARYFQRPDITRITNDTTRTFLNGLGISAKIGKWSKGHWRYHEEYILRSPGLELNDLGYMTLSNLMKNNTSVSYFEKENTHIFKTYDFNVLQQNAWNAQGQGLYSLVALTAETEFINSWGVNLTGQYKFRQRDEWILRGGPSMRIPDQLDIEWSMHTNTARNFYVTLSGNHFFGLYNSLNYLSLASDFTYRPRSNLALTIQPTYLENRDELQYIAEVQKSNSTPTWIIGRVDNRNLGITFRVDLGITPELMIQYYGSPFVSTGKYSNFKEVTQPKDNRYENRFNQVSPKLIGNIYAVDEDNNGEMEYIFYNPDFNYQQFRSNLVLRWEYRAGSAFYLVWAQDRTLLNTNDPIDLNQGFRNMTHIFPQNIFMIKFNYWFSR